MKTIIKIFDILFYTLIILLQVFWWLLKVLWVIWCAPGKAFITYYYLSTQNMSMKDYGKIAHSARVYANRNWIAPFYSIAFWPMILGFIGLLILKYFNIQ